MTRTKTQRRALVGLSSLIVAHYVSWFGNIITTVTVPLYVLGMTESGVQTGLAGFANTLPLVVAGALAGVFIDRLGGRAVSVAADLAAGALTLVLPFLIEGPDSPFVFLLVVLFVRSLIAAPAASARLSLIERMSSDAGVRLESSNTLFQSAQRVALIVGAPLAGVLFVVWGGPTALFIDAGTFFVAAIILWFGVPKPREDGAPSSDGDAGSRSYFGMLADGFTYVRSSPLIVAILAVIMLSNFLDDAFAPLLLPAYSVEVLGSAGLLGVLLAGAGIGSVIGMFLYIPASGRVLRNRYWTFVASLLVVGLLRLVLVAYPSLPLAVVVVFLVGLAGAPLNPLLVTVMQILVPTHLQGRVFSLVSGLAMAAVPLGVLTSGVALDLVGLRASLAIFAGGYVVLVAVCLCIPALRGLNVKAKETDEVAAA